METKRVHRVKGYGSFIKAFLKTLSHIRLKKINPCYIRQYVVLPVNDDWRVTFQHARRHATQKTKLLQKMPVIAGELIGVQT